MGRQQGMTLIEILVALGIFVMLGSGLVMFLRDGISTWQVGESRREAIERAEAILEPMCADLRSLFTQPDPGPGGGFPPPDHDSRLPAPSPLPPRPPLHHDLAAARP